MCVCLCVCISCVYVGTLCVLCVLDAGGSALVRRGGGGHDGHGKGRGLGKGPSKNLAAVATRAL